MPGGTPAAASEPVVGSTTSRITRYSPGTVGAVSWNSTSAVAPGSSPAGSIELATAPTGPAGVVTSPPRPTQRATSVAWIAGPSPPIRGDSTTAGWPQALW